MASIKQHNNLIKICFDGNKHLKHVLNNEEVRSMTMIESRYPLTKLPVCGHCEGLAYWGKNGCGICKKCGTVTKNPITYSSYLASGFDVDPTGATAKDVLKTEQEIREIILPDYGR